MMVAVGAGEVRMGMRVMVVIARGGRGWAVRVLVRRMAAPGRWRRRYGIGVDDRRLHDDRLLCPGREPTRSFPDHEDRNAADHGGNDRDDRYWNGALAH